MRLDRTGSSSKPHRDKRRERDALRLAAAYVAALIVAMLLFVAYRASGHHATFAARQFFWVGDVHQDDPAGYRMRPDRNGFAVLNFGVHDPARHIPVRTDAAGFRIPLDADPNAPVQTGGIAAIGCSCTFAHGVAADSSYVQLAAGLLGLPAANMGVCGYGPVSSLLLLERHLPRLQPRVVVYGFANFHLERAARARADLELYQPYVECDDGGCRVTPAPLDNRLVFATQARIEELYYRPRLAGETVGWSLPRLRALAPLAGQDLLRALQPAAWQARREPPALADTAFCRFLLRRMYADCRAQNATFMLLWFPKEWGDRPAPGLVAAVAEMGALPGFAFADCSPGLFAAATDQATYAARWQVPRDGHPNRFMHLEMARVVATAAGAAGF